MSENGKMFGLQKGDEDIFYVFYVLLLAAVSRAAYMKVPPLWVCEYDELPGEMHMAGFRGRGAGSYVMVFLLAAAAALRAAGGVEEAGAEAGAAAAFRVMRFAAAAAMIVIAQCDRDYFIVPDQLVFFTGAVSIAAWFLKAGPAGAAGAVYGAAAGGGIMFAASIFSMLAVRGKAACIGFGDVKLMAACGAATGEWAPAAFSAASLMAGFYCSAGIVSGRVQKAGYIPFAPWICMGTILFML